MKSNSKNNSSVKQSKKLFKIRCSAIGQIMTDPKEKSPKEKYESHLAMIAKNEEKLEKMKNKETKTAQTLLANLKRRDDELVELEQQKDEVILSKTCISYLEDRIKENYYGRRKQLQTDAIQKGIECENEAIFVLNQHLGTSYEKADHQKMENDWCTGHEDIDDTEQKITIDTKVSASFDSFPVFEKELEKAYWRQGQGYMRLKGEEYHKHIVAKVLVNTPAWQIKKKLTSIYHNLQKKYEELPRVGFLDADFAEKSQELFLNHVFDKQLSMEIFGVSLQLTDEQVLDYGQRVQLFEFERDNEAIQKIVTRVEECRQYLSQHGY